MLLKRFSALLGDREAGIRLSPDERLLDEQVASLLQSTGVPGQVAVAQVQQFFEGIEIHVLVDHQRGHDAEPDPALEGFVQFLEIIFHLDVVWFRSYFQYNITPYTRCSAPKPKAHNRRPFSGRNAAIRPVSISSTPNIRTSLNVKLPAQNRDTP